LQGLRALFLCTAHGSRTEHQLTEMTPAEEARIGALAKKAAS
jgi:hypothetical protein